MDELCLQERFAPHNACFGCGPANSKGLRLQSFPKYHEVIAHFTPEVHHEAFPGILNGGIIGTLLDCHSNWTAAWYLMQQRQENTPPCTVTSEYAIKLLRPTPTKGPVMLISNVVEFESDRARVFAKLLVDDNICATCEGIFVAVKPGHPAYHRW